jgi:hypothetical protein
MAALWVCSGMAGPKVRLASMPQPRRAWPGSGWRRRPRCSGGRPTRRASSCSQAMKPVSPPPARPGARTNGAATTATRPRRRACPEADAQPGDPPASSAAQTGVGAGQRTPRPRGWPPSRRGRRPAATAHDPRHRPEQQRQGVGRHRDLDHRVVGPDRPRRSPCAATCRGRSADPVQRHEQGQRQRADHHHRADAALGTLGQLPKAAPAEP